MGEGSASRVFGGAEQYGAPAERGQHQARNAGAAAGPLEPLGHAGEDRRSGEGDRTAEHDQLGIYGVDDLGERRPQQSGELVGRPNGHPA